MGLDEESRQTLQERLELLAKLMFWSFVVLLGSIALLYWQYPKIGPARKVEIFEWSGGGLAVLAVIWRGVLVRRRLTIEQLHAIDLFFAAGTGFLFGLSGYLSRDFEPSAYACLLYACFMVLLRTMVVPSTGARTAVTSALTFLPMTIATIVNVTTIDVKTALPAMGYVLGDVVVSVIVMLLAIIGSRTIFGLRRKVSEAMQLGQYTLGSMIGEGGNGAVYHARHCLLRRPTAIKLLRPERIDADTLVRFEREVQAMSRLTHPNTVAIYDYGHNPDGVFYYAMEYLDGIDLEQLVERHGPQAADRVIAILVQVCGALGEAHRNGFTHRDVKPANVILCERGGVPDIAKVVDFGLVKDVAVNSLESDGAVVGTPAYVAPEAVLAPDRVGPSADIYAVGAVGYYLLTGKRVFEGASSIDIIVKHVTLAPTLPSQIGGAAIPEPLEQLLMRCLAKQPEQRPESAAELAKLLRALPPANDWSDERATAWWTAFRETQDPNPATSAPTATITVDITERVEMLPSRLARPGSKTDTGVHWLDS